MKVLLVGVDAACAPVLEPMFEEGRLPTLERLFAEGASADLESGVPPWTPSMWPSIYTGVNPGKHGVFGFLRFSGYDYDVVNRSHVRAPALWELLDSAGHSSVVVNVPVTHPPRPFDGALIPGYAAPEDPTCHPEGLLEEVRNEIGDYRVYSEEKADPDEALSEYRAAARMRGEAFRYLAGKHDPDFGFVQFQVTDTVFHEHPGNEAVTTGVYEAVDEQVGETIEACDPDVVIVASDHGIGEYSGYGVRMNDVLIEAGLATATDGGGMPSWVPIREGRLRQGRPDGSDDPGVVERGVGLATAAGLSPRRVGKALDRLGLKDAVSAVVPDEAVRAGSRRVDFANSTAFMRARIELGVRVNLRGREPEGIVPESEYEAVREELIELFSGLETPEGEPVFETVARREEVYHGPETEQAVDVVTVPAGYDHFLTAELLEEPFGPPGQPWNHKRHGAIAVSGEGVDVGAPLGDPHVLDVAPTVLAAMGVPASDEMDGRTLPVVESAGERSYGERDDGATRETADDAVEDRLADLGYLDNA